MNKIIPAVLEHVEELTSKVRRADLAEMRASSDFDPETLLLMSFTLSTEVYTWMHGDEVVAVFGLAPDLDAPGIGCPWMIGSEAVKRHPKWFLNASRKVIEHFNRQFPLLENYVHPDNHLSIRYLKRCGFQFAEPEPFGPKGELFLPFFKESPSCAP